MANVYIDGKRIVPAPLYAISHDITRTNGGVILSCAYNITLTGSIIANRGYPMSTGGFSTSTDDALDIVETGIVTQEQAFASLLNKQMALKELALLEGPSYGSNKKVSIVHTSGGAAGQTSNMIEFNYLSANVEFEPSTTVNVSNYTITFSANDVRLNGRSINPASGSYQDYNLKSASDSLTVSRENNRDNSVQITRNVKAQGYKSYDADVQATISAVSGWQFAKEWVKAQFPADPTDPPTTAINGVPIISLPDSYGYFGAVMSEEVDKLSGDYGVNIVWTYGPKNASGSYAVDEYSISKTDSIVGNKTNYKISGNIKGIRENRKKTEYEAAQAYFNSNITTSVLKNRIASAFSVATGSILGPLNSIVGHSDFGGTITYEYDFYRKIATLPDCFFDVDLSVSKNEDERIIAEIPIPGRSAGPIIQDIKTRQTIKRSVTANFTLAQSGSSFNQMAALKGSGFTFLGSLGAVPTGTANSDYWQTSFSHNLDIVGGKYSMNIGYVEKQ